jgi:hypothetical protein
VPVSDIKRVYGLHRVVLIIDSPATERHTFDDGWEVVGGDAGLIDALVSLDAKTTGRASRLTISAASSRGVGRDGPGSGGKDRRGVRSD